MHLRPPTNGNDVNARVRARAHRRRCKLAATKHGSPTPCRTERHFKAERCKRLGSRSRDPVGYVDGLNLFEYTDSMPTFNIDPSGRDNFLPEGARGVDVNLFPVGSDMWHNAEGQPIENGVIKAASHCTSDGIPVSKEELVELLRNTPRWTPKHRVRLMMCGVTRYRYPQYVADKLRCKVEAATTNVHFGPYSASHATKFRYPPIPYKVYMPRVCCSYSTSGFGARVWRSINATQNEGESGHESCHRVLRERYGISHMEPGSVHLYDLIAVSPYPCSSL